MLILDCSDARLVTLAARLRDWPQSLAPGVLYSFDALIFPNCVKGSGVGPITRPTWHPPSSKASEHQHLKGAQRNPASADHR